MPEQVSNLLQLRSCPAVQVGGPAAIYSPQERTYLLLTPVPCPPSSGEALAGFLALKPTGTIETKTTDLAGDIALLHSPWTQVGTDEDGSEVSFSGITAEVVRQQADGTWKYVIDDRGAVPSGNRSE